MDDDKGDLLLIADNDSLDAEFPCPSSQRKGFWFPKASKCWLLALAAVPLALLLLVLFYADLQQSAIPFSKARDENECGHTAEEAHRNGCVYSFIPGAWVPIRCHDAELEAEFLGRKEWRWWADNQTRQELSLDVIRSQRGENPIYVTNEYHDFHCVYTWKALHRAVIRHSLIDTHIGNFTHTKHCSRSLEAAWRRKSKMSTFYPIYATCMDPNYLDTDAIHGLDEPGAGV